MLVETFKWSSSLGISVIIFLAIGALWLTIGILTMILLNRTAAQYLFVSNSADTAFFGDSPKRLLEDDLVLFKLRTILIRVIAGFLTMSGVLFIFLAWFALRESQSWALIALGLGGVSAIILWAVALNPYVREGVHLRISDIPPLMWVPALLLIPGIFLGWVGLN